MNVIDSSPTRTASEGRATVGKKRGDAPWAALRFALGYHIMPLWGGGNEKTPGDGPSPSSRYHPTERGLSPCTQLQKSAIITRQSPIHPLRPQSVSGCLKVVKKAGTVPAFLVCPRIFVSPSPTSILRSNPLSATGTMQAFRDSTARGRSPVSCFDVASRYDTFGPWSPTSIQAC